MLVVDDQQLIRDGIASLLPVRGHHGRRYRRQRARSPGEGRRAEAHAVLMDVRMPGLDGVEAVAVLRGRMPECRVGMATTFADEEYVVQTIRAGASGCLLKDLPADELAQAIRLAHAGVTQLDASELSRLAVSLPAPAPGPAELAAALSPREIDIPRRVGQGCINREIAAQLCLSEGTVKKPPLPARPNPGGTARP
ncbi:response regulator transcription factor [Streptomyces sp. RP5T]|uniref:response regulator transcription factor n=1 Tax=Streptomyces sp. RP5T TaxID=2490848 RepID=UPI0028971725|nr:response regulator transcription factor [Streptomyces sp. RP5T]